MPVKKHNVSTTADEVYGPGASGDYGCGIRNYPEAIDDADSTTGIPSKLSVLTGGPTVLDKEMTNHSCYNLCLHTPSVSNILVVIVVVGVVSDTTSSELECTEYSRKSIYHVPDGPCNTGRETGYILILTTLPPTCNNDSIPSTAKEPPEVGTPANLAALLVAVFEDMSTCPLSTVIYITE